jgi:hypothetical protein
MTRQGATAPNLFGAVVALALCLAAPAAHAEIVRHFDDWSIECVEGGEQVARLCAARTQWRDAVSLFVIRRAGEPFVLVQLGRETGFERGDSVSIRAGGEATHTVAPQRRQTAIFAGAEARALIESWGSVEAAGGGGGLFGSGANVIVQVRQTAGAGRISRFSLKGFGVAMAALTDIDSGYQPPAAEGDAAPPSIPAVVDDMLNRLRRLFQ